jgi:hypothetical protein
MRNALAWVALVASLGSVATARVPNPLGITADELAVRRATLDYVEGIYLRDATRVKRSIHPRVHWLGVDEIRLGYRDLVHMATNKCRSFHVESDSPRRMRVTRIVRNAATVNVATAWGDDTIELKKHDGRWKIVRIQSEGLARHAALTGLGRDAS